MSKEENGGAAFPCQAGYDFRGERVTTTSEGMTLRDYFAAKALQGQIVYEGMEGCDPVLIAGCAYELADAMLEARRK